MKRVNIGVITNTHGLKGEVKVKCLTDFPEMRFKKGNTIHMQNRAEGMSACIQNIRMAKDLMIIKFEGYDDINQVEAWKGNMLSVTEDELHTLEDDEAYYYEIQDSEVYDMDEHYIGKVVEIIETGANAVLRVKMEKRDVLIPFVKAFVKEFDKKEKKMKVELIEGLL